MRGTETFHKLRVLLKHPGTTANDMAAVISEDEVLAKRILKIIEWYEFPPKYCTLAGAVVLLGPDAIRTLVNEALNL